MSQRKAEDETKGLGPQRAGLRAQKGGGKLGRLRVRAPPGELGPEWLSF